MMPGLVACFVQDRNNPGCRVFRLETEDEGH